MQTATHARPGEPEDCAPPPPAAGSSDSGSRETAGDGNLRRDRTGRRRAGLRQRQLPLRTRIILGTAGGLLVVLGIAGLFLPFLQGILFLVLAAAALSLTSRRIYRWLGSAVGDRWPGAWQRVERFRTRVRWKLRKK